jgi:hypothetical protein
MRLVRLVFANKFAGGGGSSLFVIIIGCCTHGMPCGSIPRHGIAIDRPGCGRFSLFACWRAAQCRLCVCKIHVQR